MITRLDFKFNETFFICKCSNVSSLNLNRYPLFYQKSIQEWTTFLHIFCIILILTSFVLMILPLISVNFKLFNNFILFLLYIIIFIFYVTFVKNRTFKKISNICFLNALYLTDSYQITILINTLNVGTVNLNEKNMMFGLI
jgi:amino acid permease